MFRRAPWSRGQQSKGLRWVATEVAFSAASSGSATEPPTVWRAIEPHGLAALRTRFGSPHLLGACEEVPAVDEAHAERLGLLPRLRGEVRRGHEDPAPAA